MWPTFPIYTTRNITLCQGFWQGFVTPGKFPRENAKENPWHITQGQALNYSLALCMAPTQKFKRSMLQAWQVKSCCMSAQNRRKKPGRGRRMCKNEGNLCCLYCWWDNGLAMESRGSMRGAKAVGYCMNPWLILERSEAILHLAKLRFDHICVGHGRGKSPGLFSFLYKIVCTGWIVCPTLRKFLYIKHNPFSQQIHQTSFIW